MLTIRPTSWPPSEALRKQLDDAGYEIREQLDATKQLLVEARPGTLTTLSEVRAWSDVETAEPDFPIRAFVRDARRITRVDELPEAQSHSLLATVAPSAGEGIVVGVIDTGIDDTHPGLAGRVLSHADYTGEGR